MRQLLVLFAAVLLVAGCSSSETGGSAASPSTSPSRTALAVPSEVPSPAGGAPTEAAAFIGGPANPCNLWPDDQGRVWVAHLGGRVASIDATSGETMHRHRVQGTPCAVAELDGTVWVASLTRTGSNRPAHVVGIDPDTGDEVASVTVTGQPWDLIAAFDALWVTFHDGTEVVRIDPRTRQITDRFEVGARPTGLAWSSDRVWATANGSDDPALVGIDPTGRTVTSRVDLGEFGRPLWVAADDDRVYVTTTDPYLVVAVDADDGAAVWATKVPDAPLDPTISDERLWVPHNGGEVSVLDTADGTLLGLAETDDGLAVAAAVGDEVWVPVYGSSGVHRFGPAEDWSG